eukprot:jgi/Mesvir1/329/Mv22736-RA.1
MERVAARRTRETRQSQADQSHTGESQMGEEMTTPVKDLEPAQEPEKEVSPFQREREAQARAQRLYRDCVDCTPEDFELYCSWLFECLGYHTTVTKRTRDGGCDIILTRSGGNIFSLVQCKQWVSCVGVEQVRAFYGAMDNYKPPAEDKPARTPAKHEGTTEQAPSETSVADGASLGKLTPNEGFVVTTSHFSQCAKDFVKNRKSLNLWGKDELLNHFLKHEPKIREKEAAHLKEKERQKEMERKEQERQKELKRKEQERQKELKRKEKERKEMALQKEMKRKEKERQKEMERKEQERQKELKRQEKERKEEERQAKEEREKDRREKERQEKERKAVAAASGASSYCPPPSLQGLGTLADSPVALRRPSKSFTDAEAAALKAGVAQFGTGNWKAILKRYPHVWQERTPQDLKDKWRNIQKKESSGDVLREPFAEMVIN